MLICYDKYVILINMLICYDKYVILINMLICYDKYVILINMLICYDKYGILINMLTSKHLFAYKLCKQRPQVCNNYKHMIIAMPQQSM